MEWKNDAELFELMRKQLYTANVGDVLDDFGHRRQFLPIVFGDIDGVVVVPSEMEVHIITAALEKSRKEETAILDLAIGLSATKVFKSYGIF